MINKQKITLTLSAGRKDQLIRDNLPQIAFSGRSNVGKSSLLNRLAGRKKLARVSAEPGKTITVNYFNIDSQLYLVDLPGYGFAKRRLDEKKKWSDLTNAYFQNNEKLLMVLQLIDIKTGPSADDEMMLDWLNATGTPYVVAATKWDKLNKTNQQKNLAALRETVGEETPVFPISSLTGEGVEILWNLIEKSVAAVNGVSG